MLGRMRLLKPERHRKREDITIPDTSHLQNETGQDSTRAGRRERERRDSEVESESRAEGVLACDDCMVYFSSFPLYSLVHLSRAFP